MLAERKHKMKWSPNPCGNLWTKDSNKFGQKILEKFGWSPGKGLGVKEQGIVDPVRLKCNSTQKGLGYEKGNKTDFFQHQDQFNSILSSLNSSTGNSDEMNNKSVSLEERSKNCKTRVHYHKFTRGKDLSRYSEKDLSCILGIAFKLDEQINSSEVNIAFSETYNGFKSPPTAFDYKNNLIGEQTPSKVDIAVEAESKKLKNKKKRNCDAVIDGENDSITCDNSIDESLNYKSTFQSQDSNGVPHETKKRKRKMKSEVETNVNGKSNSHFVSGTINDELTETYNFDVMSFSKISKKKKKKHKKNK